MTRHDTKELTFHEKAVLKLVTHAAEMGEPCPSNLVIADVTGSTSGSALVASLERKGLIRVERGNSKRVVTILATGRRTAGQIRKPHWRDRPETRTKARKVRPKVALAQEPAPESLPRVDRDTCFWCGARGDACRCGRRSR